MRMRNIYRLTSFDHSVEHDFKAGSHAEAIEKCKDYDMPERSMLHYVKDSGSLKGIDFICWIK